MGRKPNTTKRWLLFFKRSSRGLGMEITPYNPTLEKLWNVKVYKYLADGKTLVITKANYTAWELSNHPHPRNVLERNREEGFDCMLKETTLEDVLEVLNHNINFGDYNRQLYRQKEGIT